MRDTTNPKPGFMFWVIGTLALFWNLLGVMIYVMQVTATPERLSAAYTPEEMELLTSIPAWATAMTAIASNFGALGSILLLMRRTYCVPVFAISLGALIVQDIYTFAMTNTLEIFGLIPFFIQVVVLLVALFLLWYSRRAAQKGWLR
jgi:hypothetical protein